MGRLCGCSISERLMEKWSAMSAYDVHLITCMMSRNSTCLILTMKAATCPRLALLRCLAAQTDRELIGRLPDLFSNLIRVVVHDCPRFGLDWARSVKPAALTRYPCELEVDFSRPRHYDFKASPQGIIGLPDHAVGEWRKCLKMPAIAQWIYEDAQEPGSSILLSNPIMLDHVLYLCNDNNVNINAYDAKDLVHVYGHGRRATPWLTEDDIINALSGGKARVLAFLEKVVRAYNKKYLHVPLKTIKSLKLWKDNDCEHCGYVEPDNDDDDAKPLQHPGEARDRITAEKAGDHWCSRSLLMEASNDHFSEIRDTLLRAGIKVLSSTANGQRARDVAVPQSVPTDEELHSMRRGLENELLRHHSKSVLL